MPPLLTSDQIVGTLLPEVAKELGLPVDCAVSTGGGDNMMGAIGTGNVRPGVVTVSLGTSSTVYSYRDEPAHDDTGNAQEVRDEIADQDDAGMCRALLGTYVVVSRIPVVVVEFKQLPLAA